MNRPPDLAALPWLAAAGVAIAAIVFGLPVVVRWLA